MKKNTKKQSKSIKDSKSNTVSSKKDNRNTARNQSNDEIGFDNYDEYNNNMR